MATGYTQGIINGEITNVKDFAKICMRAFGACSHMRDDSMDTPYYPREVSNFYLDELNTYKFKLEELKNLSDDELINKRTIELNEDKEYQIKYLEKAKLAVDRLIKMRDSIESNKLESPEFNILKDFMLSAVRQELNWTTQPFMYENRIRKIEEELATMNVDDLRKELSAKYQKEVDYYQRCYNDDVIRCNEANEWVENIFKVILISEEQVD